MNEGRLGEVSKLQARSRKRVAIANDQARESGNIEIKRLLCNEHVQRHRMYTNMVMLKRYFAEIKSIQWCLKAKRKKNAGTTMPLGRYDGVPLESFKREVKNVIDEMEPRKVRMRKIQNLLQTGAERGLLVNNKDTITKFHQMMDRPSITKHDRIDEIELKPRSTLILPPIYMSKSLVTKPRQAPAKPPPS